MKQFFFIKIKKIYLLITIDSPKTLTSFTQCVDQILSKTIDPLISYKFNNDYLKIPKNWDYFLFLRMFLNLLLNFSKILFIICL